MKIIELDKSKSQSYDLYTTLDNLFYFLAENLPKFFLEPVNLNGEIYHLPKYITKLHYDTIDPQTQDLINELNKQLQ